MSMTPQEAYENLMTRAVLTRDNRYFTEAHVISTMFRFNHHQIQTCHANVERWLRLHGVTQMRASEIEALLLIQSCIRRWLVMNKLKHQYELYTRLAKLDSPDHCGRALALESILTCARKHIHSR